MESVQKIYSCMRYDLCIIVLNSIVHKSSKSANVRPYLILLFLYNNACVGNHPIN